ncbi:Hypothetical protein A7982_02160 [Minicystis rosea]|nr:Hypothetical protein A7982_02160 [Minicystis rosea]
MVDEHGPGWVVIDGSAFFEEAQWLYEEHHTMPELSFTDAETATFVVPHDVLAAWKDRIDKLPAAGRVATESSKVVENLRDMIRQVLSDRHLRLTLESLL